MPLLNRTEILKEVSERPVEKTDILLRLWKLNNIDMDKIIPIYNKFAKVGYHSYRHDRGKLVPNTLAKLDFNLNYLKLDPEDIETVLLAVLDRHEELRMHKPIIKQVEDTLSYLQNLMKHSSPSSSHSSYPPQPSSHSSHQPQSSSHSSHTSNLVQLQNGNTIDLSQAPLPPKKLTLTYAKEYPGHTAYYFNQGIFCDNKENIKRAIKFSNLTTSKYLTKGLYLYLKNTNPQAAVLQKQLTEYIYALDSKKSPRKSPKKDDRRRNSSGCLVGWSRNPKTDRCWVSKKPGYERSPKTGKWLKKCDRSQTRNPKTNRCKKTPRKKSR